MGSVIVLHILLCLVSFRIELSLSYCIVSAQSFWSFLPNKLSKTCHHIHVCDTVWQRLFQNRMGNWILAISSQYHCEIASRRLASLLREAPSKLASPLFGHCPNSDCPPPPRTQTGTLGHFFSGRFEPLCQITVLRVCKCHKESWQAFNPLLTKENT